MSTTHPNALIMEAEEKRQLARILNSQADTLEAQAAELTGSMPIDESVDVPAGEPSTGVVPDGFPIHESGIEGVQPTPSEIDETLQAVEVNENPKEQADGGEEALSAETVIEVATPTSEVPTTVVPEQLVNAEPAVYGGTESQDGAQPAGSVDANGRQVV